MAARHWHLWTGAEVIAGYLLSRAPCNRIYPKRKDGSFVYEWGTANYESVAHQLDLMYHGGEPVRATRPSTVKWKISSQRALTHEISRKISEAYSKTFLPEREQAS